MVTEPRVAVYGRTYWDAEVEVEIASITSGKGKVDASVELVQGGFAVNAGRALAGLYRAGAVRVVTLTSWHDWPRLRAALPGGVVLDALLTDDAAPPPISVILNPRRECRILRPRRDEDAADWRVDRVPSGALAARLHILGRLPADFVAGVLRRAHEGGARVAWVGGDGLADDLLRECDVVCVNAREAEALVGHAGTPRQLAEALLGRARPRDALRVVTGAGRAATAVAFREGRARRCLEAAPPPVALARIATLKGVGDAFAAHFLAAACFERSGAPRRRLEARRALAAGQRAASRFLTSRRRS